MPTGGNDATVAPSGEMRPILLAAKSVNHRFPSGPVVISNGDAPPTGNSSIVPAGLMRPTRSPIASANHTLPSGPAVIENVSPSSSDDPFHGPSVAGETPGLHRGFP